MKRPTGLSRLCILSYIAYLSTKLEICSWTFLMLLWTGENIVYIQKTPWITRTSNRICVQTPWNAQAYANDHGTLLKGWHLTIDVPAAFVTLSRNLWPLLRMVELAHRMLWLSTCRPYVWASRHINSDEGHIVSMGMGTTCVSLKTVRNQQGHFDTHQWIPSGKPT